MATVRTWRTSLWNVGKIAGRVKTGEPMRLVSIVIVELRTLSNQHVLGCAHNVLQGGGQVVVCRTNGLELIFHRICLARE